MGARKDCACPNKVLQMRSSCGGTKCGEMKANNDGGSHSPAERSMKARVSEWSGAAGRRTKIIKSAAMTFRVRGKNERKGFTSADTVGWKRHLIPLEASGVRRCQPEPKEVASHRT